MPFIGASEDVDLHSFMFFSRKLNVKLGVEQRD